MTGIQVKGCCIPDCRSGDGGRVYYVDQGVTVQGQITDIGAKVLSQLAYYSSTRLPAPGPDHPLGW